MMQQCKVLDGYAVTQALSQEDGDALSAALCCLSPSV